MSKLTPEQFAQKQATRLKAATQDITDGINRVTTAPGQLAAAKQQKMLTNITESVTSGKWARRVSSVSLEQWKDKAINKGVSRIAGGIDAAHDKVVAFASEMLPYQDAGVAKVRAMPDLTLEDGINRATAMIRHMANFKRSK